MFTENDSVDQSGPLLLPVSWRETKVAGWWEKEKEKERTRRAAGELGILSTVGRGEVEPTLARPLGNPQ
jgi:hypothetical protein